MGARKEARDFPFSEAPEQSTEREMVFQPGRSNMGASIITYAILGGSLL